MEVQLDTFVMWIYGGGGIQMANSYLLVHGSDQKHSYCGHPIVLVQSSTNPKGRARWSWLCGYWSFCAKYWICACYWECVAGWSPWEITLAALSINRFAVWQMKALKGDILWKMYFLIAVGSPECLLIQQMWRKQSAFFVCGRFWKMCLWVVHLHQFTL